MLSGKWKLARGDHAVDVPDTGLNAIRQPTYNRASQLQVQLVTSARDRNGTTTRCLNSLARHIPYKERA